MGYLKIPNLYRPEAQNIFLFKEVYCLEKCHGTSCSLTFCDDKLSFFSGSEPYEKFVSLFNQEELLAKFRAIGVPKVKVYGEGYGGKQQGMSATYGKESRFVAFEVQIGDSWLTVPKAEKVAKELGLDFVFYTKVETTLENLNRERDRFSTQAVKNGISSIGENGTIINPKLSEGIVIRPLEEFTMNNGARVIAKHKNDKFKETTTPRTVNLDETKLARLSAAQAVSDEWVTEQRLAHVLDKFQEKTLSAIPEIISAMIEDVKAESEGEIDWEDEKGIKRAIGNRTAALFKEYLKSGISQS